MTRKKYEFKIPCSQNINYNFYMYQMYENIRRRDEIK